MATLVKFTCKSFIKLTPGCCPVYMTRFYQPVVVVFRIVIIVYRVCLRLEYRLIGSAWKYQRALHVHISRQTGVILHKKNQTVYILECLCKVMQECRLYNSNQPPKYEYECYT